MLLSRSCEYGIRAVLYLAIQPPGRFVLIREMSDRLGISFHFLAKILQTLVKAKLLNSQKGRGGGFALAKPADQMTLLNVVETIDGPDITTRCMIGLPGCSDDNPCPLHEYWGQIRAEIVQMLKGNSIADLARLSSEKHLKLADSEIL